MKNTIVTLSLCIIGLMLSAGVRADEDCDLALREAKTAYNSGEYTKAKKLYDYVVSICGSSYGSASSWSQKCEDALTPKLSVSRSSISVGADSGTTSITVTSNRTWKLNNTSSSLFTVSRNGDNISISYSANPNTSSRSDYFDVVTTDGSKSVRVYVNQEANANTTPYLSVNKTSISASASGTTEYLTVSSNTTWEVQYASGTMYSVTRNGNTLTVKINANTTTESRNDYFNVKTTDGSKVQKISLSQSGKSTNSTSYVNKVINGFTICGNQITNYTDNATALTSLTSSIKSWGKVRTGAISENGKGIVIYGNNGYSYTGLSGNDYYEEIRTKIKKYHDDEERIADITFNNKGHYVIIRNNCGYGSNGLPSEFLKKLEQYHNNNEKILSVSLDNSDNWAIVTEDHFTASNNGDNEFMIEALEKYGRIESVCITTKGIVVCCSRGVYFKGVPKSVVDRIIGLANKGKNPKVVKFTDSGTCLITDGVDTYTYYL